MSQFNSYLMPTIQGLCIFKIHRGVAYQQQPVKLRNDIIKDNITTFADDLSNLIKLIGSMKDHDRSLHSRELKMLHLCLRRKLYST